MKRLVVVFCMAALLVLSLALPAFAKPFFVQSKPQVWTCGHGPFEVGPFTRGEALQLIRSGEQTFCSSSDGDVLGAPPTPEESV